MYDIYLYVLCIDFVYCFSAIVYRKILFLNFVQLLYSSSEIDSHTQTEVR